MDDKPIISFAEPDKYTVTASNPAIFLKPSYNITFSNDGGQVGALDFNGPEMKFTGNAEESAKVFFDWIAKSFAGRLEQERKSASPEAKGVDRIINELAAIADACADLHQNRTRGNDDPIMQWDKAPLTLGTIRMARWLRDASTPQLKSSE